ncbi:integrase catalytic subunit [Mycobacterium europaeum]|uniref:Integrase catalytic subunit n=1 Tax=Mycobacterium europaeum TaxID=761804 RepID=A0A0U1DDG1_9MYCO|nr:integrase catalytic subunit [Mycobacterium europaeum]
MPRRDRCSPSIGTIGDSFDNALAETVNGHYKAELIYARIEPWKTVEDVELAILGWVYWHNTARPAQLPRGHPTRRIRSQLLR